MVKKTTLRLTLTALFAALIAGGTFVVVPLPFTPVPVVLQNLFIVLSGLVLGPVLGTAAVLLFLIAGALGLPVLAGASGGIAHFAGPTGGFLAGYVLAAFTSGIIAGRPRAGTKTHLCRIVIAAALGFLAVYIPGVIWLFIWMKYIEHIDATLLMAFAGGFFPFLIGDAVKLIIIAAFAGRLRRITADLLDE
ncbi:MAG: biotin transporter BioY [Spirochaetaceae bacterium]|jgi:biotin transport system substrate-specific component|nr:biotin transporter BioY [Spirochaetaceae bacterium]